MARAPAALAAGAALAAWAAGGRVAAAGVMALALLALAAWALLGGRRWQPSSFSAPAAAWWSAATALLACAFGLLAIFPAAADYSSAMREECRFRLHGPGAVAAGGKPPAVALAERLAEAARAVPWSAQPRLARARLLEAAARDLRAAPDGGEGRDDIVVRLLREAEEDLLAAGASDPFGVSVPAMLARVRRAAISAEESRGAKESADDGLAASRRAAARVFRDALPCLDRAVALYPTDPGLWRDRADLLVGLAAVGRRLLAEGAKPDPALPAPETLAARAASDARRALALEARVFEAERHFESPEEREALRLVAEGRVFQADGR